MFPKNIKRDFLHGKSDLLFSSNNHMKKGHRTLLYAWGVMMSDHRILQYTWTATSSHVSIYTGCDDALSFGKVKIHECSRRGSSRR
jgi:hypothetical protein